MSNPSQSPGERAIRRSENDYTHRLIGGYCREQLRHLSSTQTIAPLILHLILTLFNVNDTWQAEDDANAEYKDDNRTVALNFDPANDPDAVAIFAIGSIGIDLRKHHQNRYQLVRCGWHLVMTGTSALSDPIHIGLKDDTKPRSHNNMYELNAFSQRFDVNNTDEFYCELEIRNTANTTTAYFRVTRLNGGHLSIQQHISDVTWPVTHWTHSPIFRIAIASTGSNV